MAASPDVLVIGAGIAGSVMAHEARSRGLSVVVFDPAPESGASRAALAIGRDSWHKGDQRERSAWSTRWYLARKWITFPPAAVSSAKHGSRQQSGYYLINPVAPLVQPDVFSTAYVKDTGVLVANNEEYVARLIVVAAGPRTWGLLNLPAGKVNWGHTLVSSTARAAAELIIHHYAPYQSLVVARINGGVRLGSSVAADPEASRTKVYDLLRMAQNNGFLTGPSGPKEWTEVAGIRSMHPQETGRPVWKTEHVVALSGFGRCGYSLAPAVAAEVLDRAF